MMIRTLHRLDPPPQSGYPKPIILITVCIAIAILWWAVQRQNAHTLSYPSNEPLNHNGMPVYAADSTLPRTPKEGKIHKVLPLVKPFTTASTFGAVPHSEAELFPLDSTMLPALEMGMVNVTDNKSGYHIRSGNAEVKTIAIAFDEQEIPSGYTIGDVHSYYFSKSRKSWVQLRRDSLDLLNRIVYSSNTEDGDYINAIMKAPESPETAGFVPTTMKDLKVGDPSSMIQLIEAPTPNSQGTASLRFQIETPRGRQHIEPNLYVVYSSDGANGVMGEGWSLSGLSSISVETRWGVPTYKAADESETYLWDGKMLAMGDESDNLTMAHRKMGINRTNGTKRFYCRQETNFSKIERLGNQDDYIWRVTDKNGTKYYYGGLPIAGQPNKVDAALRQGSKIAEWKLRKVEDLFGNSMEISYETKIKDIDGNVIRSLYPTQILYTLYRDDKTLKEVYKVEFSYNDTERSDFIFSARYGFLSSENSRLLETIKIASTRFLSDGSEASVRPIRDYSFYYRAGSYSKMVLDSLAQFGYEGNQARLFYGQKFHYYDFDSLAGKYFTAAEINLPEKHFLGRSETKAKLGFGGAVGIGAPDFQFTSKSLSFAAHFSYKENESESMVGFIDIDGDGRPDIVKKDGNTITYRPNTSQGEQITFGAARPISGLTSFGKDDGSSNGFGGEINGPTRSRVYSGADRGTTHSYSRYYFTDANGDGLVDIAENGEVKFNTYDGRGSSIAFTKSSARTPAPITSGESIGTTLVTEDNNRMSSELAQNIQISPSHDVVKVWIAPDSGTIRIDAPVRLVQPVLGINFEDSVGYHKADGVWVSVQQNNTAIVAPMAIAAGDFAVKPLGVREVTVKKGDKILFRVQSGNQARANGDYDQVKWNPVITYTSKNKDRHFIDPFKSDQFTFDALEDLVSGSEPFLLPDSGKYTIQGEFRKARTKDAVTLLIKVSGSVLKDSSKSTFTVKRPPAEGGDTTLNITNYQFERMDSVFTRTLDTNAQTFPTNFSVPTRYSYNTTLSFEVNPAVNMDLKAIEWRPKIVYEYFDTTEAEAALTWKKDSVVYSPKASFKGQLLKTGVFIKVKDSGVVRISPIISLRNGRNEKATVIVSDKEHILLKKEITQSQYLTDTISFVRDKNEFFTVSYEIDNLSQIDTTGATGQIPSYLLIPHDTDQWMVPQSGRYSFFSTINRALAKSFIRINGRDSVPHNRDTLANVLLKENDVISFIDSVSKRPVGFSTILTQAAAVFMNWDLADYGPLYRGWGQGVINGMSYLNRPIDVNAFRLSDVKRSQFYETAFFGMPYDLRTSRMVGVNNRIFIASDTLSSSRMSMSDVIPAPLFVVSSTINGSGARAVVKYSKSTSTTIAAGAGGFTGNTSNDGKTNTYSDYIDLNGDRYPDIAGTSSVQYTTPLGGLQKGATTLSSGLQEGTAKSKGINLGGVFFHPFLASGRAPAQKTIQVSSASSKIASALAALSIGYNTNGDEIEQNLYDVNGDGLPDKVRKDGSVFVNVGNGFSAQRMGWALKSIQENESRTLGWGGGYNFDNYSIAAGINLATTTTEQKSSLIDFNGDGLLDNVVRTGNNVVFYLNTGAGIGSSASLTVTASSKDISTSIAKSRGINGAHTFSPHIFAVLVPVCKIVLSVSANTGDGSNTVQSQWTDINGDGFIDYVSYDDKKVMVQLSQLGRINRLKEVVGPLGGRFVLDYKHVVGDFNHPGGKWVMAGLLKDDGVREDGEVSQTTFDYEHGVYDRYEREFLGFKKVVATDYLKAQPYRKSVQEFRNENYFVAHQLSKNWTEDATGKRYNYEEYTYHEKYRNRASLTTTALPTPSSLMTVAVMQTPIKTQSAYAYEGSSTGILLHQTEYAYDDLLNVSSYSYKEGNTAAEQKASFYKAEIGYKRMEVAKYIYGLPTSLVVKDLNNRVLKKVTATYPSGVFHYKMKTTTVSFDEHTSGTTTYDYDDRSGNLISKTYDNGLRDSIEYDGRFETYVTRIVDAYKLENRFTYDYGLGMETEKQLTNGLKIKTKYDAFGRAIKVQGPHQNSVDIDDADYTIKIEYYTDPGKAYSVVKHYDEAHPGEGIYTINFIDGFGRNIQVKKTGVVDGNKKWLISGRQQYDGLDRLEKSFYPTVQEYDVAGDMTIGAIGRRFISDTNRIPATVVRYDVLDRPISTQLPNGKFFERNVYTIKKDARQRDGQVKVTTYGNEGKLNKKEVFTNGTGLVSSEVFYPVAGNDAVAKTTLYHYDPLHQMDSVFNRQAGRFFLVLSNEYDWDGRKTKYFNLSGGTVRFEYDNLSNLKRKVNARSGVIEYDYEHKRLIRVRYPEHPEDSIRYVYGVKAGPGTFNSAGRIVFQIDATGAQSFQHDVFGNVMATTRTIVAPFDTTYTFSSKSSYDSWGRLLAMIYPSGEKVSYTYDIAGNLQRVQGSRYGTDAVSFRYVDRITYDAFEQRKDFIYGNELATSYTYDDTLRHLVAVKTIKDGAEIMSSTYEFDELNNIRQTKNRSNFQGMGVVRAKHDYTYDNQNQLASATGEWNESTTYTLNLAYDEQFNIKSRLIDLVSPKIKRKMESCFSYKASNPLQLDAIQEKMTRSNTVTEKMHKETVTSQHFYDSDGNDTYTTSGDSLQNNVSERKILWDEENRIRAISTNGYVSSYTYDGNGERTIKISNEVEGVYINGQFAGEHTNPATYSLYVNPYFSVRNAKGIGTKHIYIGSERIVSQLTNYDKWPTVDQEITNRHPEKDTLKMTTDLVPANRIKPVKYAKKMLETEALINSYFDSLQVPHKNILRGAFRRNRPMLQYPPAYVYPFETTAAKQFKVESVLESVGQDEKLRYFYHRSHIGSTSFVSDKDKNIVHYIEYMPFGETFMEVRKDYNSQFLFNGKEQDGETGLYYYGARYYDPKSYQWLSIDPLAEKYAGMSAYVFSFNNPVRMLDRNGMEATDELACNYATTEQEIYIEKQKEWLYKLDQADKPLEEPLISPIDFVGGIGAGLIKRGVTRIAARKAAQIGAKEGLETLSVSAASTLASEFAVPSTTSTALVESLGSILKPDGKIIGKMGSRGVRVLPGGTDAAQKLWGRLLTSSGGKVAGGYQGLRIDLPNGGMIGFRTMMTKSPGTAATIDVNIPGVFFGKLKFTP